ncbi:MAG: 16S rRNA (cytosine(1402)-N(4))-methyltransferase RsmH [Puniceicoccales bacterium]|jgi:16S rRNA (cytosine1402-N4)-methyltransferase|nr:16S rRNA (cytosine(1402)-N(4))-methyltransferase RsmH [Puniceicoccales bacterium]
MMQRAQLTESHCPVLSDEVIGLLNAHNGGKFLDCTFGGGGHSEAMLHANGENFVYAIDCDPDAKKRAQEFSLRHKNFRFYRINFVEVQCLPLPPLSGILMDLGVSSFQLDEEWRGFSFKFHAPLDMRMDNGSGITAEKFLRTADERDLTTAIRDYGEEEQWKKIVRAIVENRTSDAMGHGDTFAKFVANCIGKPQPSGIHPATKVFHGIRIFINDELNSLEAALPAMFDKLAVGGRLAVISFHSLEDRIVKRFFNAVAGKAIDRFDGRSHMDRVAYGNIVTKSPVTPSGREVENNPRSRSAKLRVIEKIHNSGGAK